MPDVTIQRIIAGGQTGVDRAALDLADELGIPSGGWCPKGRRAEDGRIPGRYQLRETTTEEPAERTALNVRDSDGTLIICTGVLAGGTALTERLALETERPCLRIDPGQPATVPADRQIVYWLRERRISVLNIAGPRESEQPGIYRKARQILERVFK